MTDHRQLITTENYRELPNDFFKKSHALVFSQLGLTAREHDTFALFLSRLHEDHWLAYQDGRHVYAPEYTFQSEVLKEWFGLSSKQLYPTLKPMAARLASRKVGLINEKDQEFDFMPLFSRVAYKKGALIMVPNAELMDAYLAQSAGHAQINHLSFRSLKSEHSKRLYTILSRFKKSGMILHEQTIEQLHGLFGLLDEKGKLTKSSYSNNKVFLERCIRKPIEELSSSEEVKKELGFLVDPDSGSYGYKARYRGKTIVALEFLFQWKQKSDNKAEAIERSKLAEEKVPDNPMLMLAKEAFNIVLSYPVNGELTAHHRLAIESVKMGIISMPADMLFDATFYHRLELMK